MALIVMKRSMSETVRGGIPDIENAKDFYDAIAAKYKESEKAETGNLMNALISMKFDGVGSVREYIMKGTEIAAKLKDLKIPIEEAMLVHIVLNSLPPQYSQLLTTYNTQKDKWSLNELISICVQEEDRIKKGKGIAVNLVSKPKTQYKPKKYNFKPNSASTSKVVQGSQNFKSNKNTSLKCFFCRKPGHVKKDCRGFKDWLIKKALGGLTLLLQFT
ncbi:putative RNA-directed DNA polymerase [Rosa chinensis]|uniref:Putative RNA-directed DNA polymerase n=1 Tax=Rosa chinensis TaxID=74649 RepID=A0A2P6QJZ1_ROSCH|nr:putative RNA-directed DNA polymerase [Rosa chinensis]